MQRDSHKEKGSKLLRAAVRKALPLGLTGVGLGGLALFLTRRLSEGTGEKSGENDQGFGGERGGHPSRFKPKEKLLHIRSEGRQTLPPEMETYVTGYENMPGERISHVNNLAFEAFPYLCLLLYAGGLVCRRIVDPFHWNANSTEVLEKSEMKYASPLFHYGVLFTFIGHAGGLLVPQKIYDAAGISGRTHTRIAIILGMIFGFPAFLGNLMLLQRRITQRKVLLNSGPKEFLTPSLLLSVIGIGTYNVFFDHYYVLNTVAPWIRSIVSLRPKPELMITVPLTYKLHVLAAFALFAYYPFSRLPHSWSAPVWYAPRSYILFRSQDGGF